MAKTLETHKRFFAYSKKKIVDHVAAAILSIGMIAHGSVYAQEQAPEAESKETKPLTVAEFERMFKEFGLSDQDASQSVGATTPLNPEQIRSIRHYSEKIKEASTRPLKKSGKPSISSKMISLEPGVKPEVIRLEQGVASSIVFQDNTGAPWPIKMVVTGSEDWVTENAEGSNILILSPKALYAQSNLTVLLKDAPAPVIFDLRAGDEKEVDYRLDAIIQARGPNSSRISLDGGRSAAIPSQMISIQDGVGPDGSERLKTSLSDEVQVWRHKGKLYVRSRMAISSPAPTKASHSPDGVKVYEISQTPVIFMLSNGKTVRVAISL